MTSAVALLTGTQASLPKSRREADKDFLAYVRQSLDEMCASIAGLSSKDPLTSAVIANLPSMRAASKDLVTAIDATHRGRPNDAYAALSRAIGVLLPSLNGLVTKNSTVLLTAFRIRLREGNVVAFPKTEFLHIPTGKRHLVKRQRYSLPGVPCLYIGASLYTCWVEFGEPPLDQVHVSRFATASGETIKFLDFGYPDDFIAPLADAAAKAGNNPDLFNFGVAHATTWPLRFCAAIRRFHGDSPHIDEYIIPQLILQWVAEHDEWDGVRYASTNIDWTPSKPEMACNYAFPVRDPAPDGLCRRIRKKFEFTEPISWTRVISAKLPQKSNGNTGADIKLANGVTTDYGSTDFAIVESRLQALAAARV